MTSKGIINLTQLQNLVKRDPESYRDETEACIVPKSKALNLLSKFMQQYDQYRGMLQLLAMTPSMQDESMVSLLMFIAQVSHCYPEIQSEFSQQLFSLLQSQGKLLSPTTRMALCKALIVLRHKGIVSSLSLVELFFGLMKCQDKQLRKTMYNVIVYDIKKINQKHRNVKLNTSLQNYLYTMVKDGSAISSKMALDILIELYRKNVWKDCKTVNAIAMGLFSSTTKVLVASMNFFLGSDAKDEGEDSDDETEVKPSKKSEKNIKLANRVAKKSKKRQKRMERAIQALKKNKKKQKSESFNFSAVHLLYDPQDLAERMFSQLQATNEKFEIKMMMMNLISRLVGIHQLILINLYPTLDRFIQPHQREVTKILMFLAQASHEMVPPEIILTSIKSIANNFITERNSTEVMAVGLNAIREVCNRCPLAMSKDLLDDLVLYKSNKDKGVSVAARSLINLYRERNPLLLNRTDRGRPTEATKSLNVLDFGQLGALDHIPGAEVLSDDENKEEEEDKKQDDWESCSEDEEGSEDGSWVDVSHSSDEAEEEKEELKSMSAEDRRERSRSIVETRVLTQDDFKKINSIQIQRSVAIDKSNKSSKKRQWHDSDNMEERGEIVSLSHIEDIHKKRRHDRESRLETVMAGREGREKFSHGVVKMNPHASKSNVEKRKQKNFQMVKHKIKATKGKRSFHEKKMALATALLRKMKSKK